MRAIVRQGTLLVLAAILSWWVLLRVPPAPMIPRTRPVPPPALEVTPLIRELAPIVAATELVARASATPSARPEEQPPETVATAPEPSSDPEAAPAPRRLGTPDEQAPEQAQSEPASAAPVAALPADRGEPSEEKPAETSDPSPAPPPPEIGTPDGEPQHEAVSSGASELPSEELEPVSADEATGAAEPSVPAPAPRTDRSALEALMRDPELLAEARAEFSRGHRKGFTTVLLAAPEDQLAIARFFGEELVLVPRRALDAQAPDPSYFRVSDSGEPRVVAVEGAPPLEGFRQYRDLFDYEYRYLPAPLQALRRSVPARGEIYLFAALLSAEEWALVIARREAALAQAGRELAEVRRFVLRSLHLPEEAFDLAVDEIVFADGTRFRPAERGTRQ